MTTPEELARSLIAGENLAAAFKARQNLQFAGRFDAVNNLLLNARQKFGDRVRA